jgi:hypothetical protein
MIISILKTMDRLPVVRNERDYKVNKNLRNKLSLIFPDEIKILDPPK